MPKRRKVAKRAAGKRRTRCTKRDTQRNAVYKWEWCFAETDRNDLSKKEVKKLLKWAFKQMGIKRPIKLEVRFIDSGDASSHDGRRNRVSFIRAHRNVPVVLHEVSHAITELLFGRTVESHGAEFMGIYLFLLEKADLWPRGMVTHSAKKAGLAIDYSMGPAVWKQRD